MKILPVGAELVHADRWTDMRKLIVAFSNCENAPKNAAFCVLFYFHGSYDAHT